MQTFRYSRSLLNRHGFLGAATAHAAACVAFTPARRCYGPELPGAADGVVDVSASRACSRARISSGV
jgi:hypothetical protein